MFDYVKLRFAYHHFADKKRAFGEIRRVLRPHGVLSIQNLSHDYMRNSWVYRYFPSSAAIDRERFLDTDALIGMLRELGFSVSAAITVRIEELPYRDILHEARNRDMSQLTLIPEKEYQAGLRRIEADAQKAEALPADIALLDMTCARRGEPDRYR